MKATLFVCKIKKTNPLSIQYVIDGAELFF